MGRDSAPRRRRRGPAGIFVPLWAVLLHAGVAGISADCPGGEDPRISAACPARPPLVRAPVHAGGSCLLTGRVDTSSSVPSLRLAFADAGGSATGAEMGIEVRGVVERAADGSIVGEKGARGSWHTRYSFEEGEFSYTSAGMLATELPRSGFPPQVDGNLRVLYYSFFAGQNAGAVATNQVILDVMVFTNSGVWVDSSGRHARVVCGHVAVEPKFENWHMCGQSQNAQDGCARGEEGAMLDFMVRLINVDNFAPVTAVNDGYRSPRLNVAHMNSSLSAPTPRAVKFDTDFAHANMFVLSDVYVHRQKDAGQWTSAPRPRQPGDSCQVPEASDDPWVPECSRWRERGYTRCKDMGGCRVSLSCGCIPAQCSCGDDDCINGKGPTSVRRLLEHSQRLHSPPAISPGTRQGASGKKITICHATSSLTNPYVQITVSESAVAAHERHDGDIIPAPSTGCSTCSAILAPTQCRDTPGCKFEGACGCISSACMCGDTCCISGVCSGLATGITESSGEPCELFFASMRRDPDNGANEIMTVRFPAGSDSFGHSSLLWLGGSADSDGDGISDEMEGPGDLDRDGVANMLDWDSDGDGILDEVEGTNDRDGDFLPNFLDDDSDGDGIPDSVEGVDCTGVLRDTLGHGTPDYLNLDSDGDGIPDAVEGVGDADLDSIPNYRDLDSDDDGIPDAVEGHPAQAVSDEDKDGYPNFLDDDSDGDGIPDAVEGLDDPDRDGRPSHLDLDSDGDGIPDATEGVDDANGNGVPNYLDLDSDGDGILDVLEGRQDEDGDGIANFLDLDSDGDGLLDSQEGIQDIDGDGLPNFVDKDSDGDRIPDAIEYAVTKMVYANMTSAMLSDPDGDGIVNWWDSDSDNDGLPDSEEGYVQTTALGLPLFLDPREETTEADDIADDPQTRCVSRCPYPARQTMDLNVDTDTDNDGIPDAVEKSIDTDGDGLRDFEDADSDGDGILDRIECDTGNSRAHEGPPPDEQLNSRCANWRDYANTWAAAEQKDNIEKCMAQDCAQSLKSGSGMPGCRFLDGQGFCYAASSAQTWCANGGSSAYCHDGGAGWGQPPLGTSIQAQTGWTPGTFPYRGSSADKGSLACACMKDCACTNGVCRCVDEQQLPTGPGSFVPRRIIKDSRKKGECVCVCNDVGTRRCSLLAIGRPKRRSETLSLASILPGRDDVAPASPPSVHSMKVCPDTDNDSIPDYLDSDSDNDGIDDVIEGLGDVDEDGVANFRDLDSDGDAVPDVCESASRDANLDGRVDFLDPAVACSSRFPGLKWRTTDRASNLHIVSCSDTVANGDSNCPIGEAGCAGKMTRFHGSVGDTFTVQCPANCGADDQTPVYGPGNGDSAAACDANSTASTFMDHSSICRAAIAKGVITGSVPGIVVIRIVEPVASYPSCPAMPRSTGDPPLCGKYREFGYSSCSDFVGCTSTTLCGCIPSDCNCGDFDCIYGNRIRPLQLIDTTPLSWPEWSRADNEIEKADFGAVSACCNYSTCPEHVERTPEGGGCCAVQRFRQKWLGRFWMGVRAFEILDDTYQSGCGQFSQQDQCDQQAGCTFKACGCIAIEGSCENPCSNGTRPIREDEIEVCVDRCYPPDFRQANVTVEPINLETSHEQGALASFTVALDSEPNSVVEVRIGNEPCELKQETHDVFVFTAQNWSLPQVVELSAVSCGGQVPGTSDVLIKTASADDAFNEIPVPRVTIFIAQSDACPQLLLPANAVVTPGMKQEAIANLERVFILNSKCAQYYENRDINPSKAKRKLDQCGRQDCQQAKERNGCPYTDLNGFCYTKSGISYCDNHPFDSRCHVSIPPLHGQCPDLLPPSKTTPKLVCSNSLGATCTISCPDGFAAGPSTLECRADTRTWNATVPRCDVCRPGFFFVDGFQRSCTPCTDEPCGVGYYRGACDIQADARCLPCTGKPTDSVYNFTGSPYNVNACSWVCKQGFFKSGAACLPCSTSMCPAGQYRQACSATADSPCAACSQNKPANSHWTTGGLPFSSDNCQWACDIGYYLNTDAGECMVAVEPALVVENNSPGDLSEGGGPEQTVRIKLSTQPTSPVVVTMNHDIQINVSPRIINVSASNWASFNDILVSAFDDKMHESSQHFGVLTFEIQSDDPVYDALEVSPISFGIIDNDCPPLQAPKSGSVVSCSNTHGDSCTIVCDAGHAPSSPVVLTCQASSSTWDATAPACDRCLDAHYRAGIHCRPCTNFSCVAGQIRGNCSAEADSICHNCPLNKPAHSLWRAGCSWMCDAGYTELGGICSPLPVPRLIVMQPRPNASESSDEPVQLRVAISREPSVPVTLAVSVIDGQLNLTNGGNFTFTPADWLLTRNVSLVAFDDDIVEGIHSGLVWIRVSSADPAWDGLAHNVSISIADNDCHALNEPQHGIIVSCRREYGGVCVFRCHDGFFPEGVISATCLASGTWSRPGPRCDTCAQGHFRDGDLCRACSTGSCSMGYFRSPCSETADSSCVPCSALTKPSNSRFVSAGMPAYADSCRWACEAGFYQSLLTCVPCSTSQCARPGFYRETCSKVGMTEDAACVACNSTLPPNAMWIANESCTWDCNRGFEENAATCIASAKPSIIHQGPSPASLREASTTTSAELTLVLSEAPTADVTVTLSISNQISLVSGAIVTFTPTSWNIPQPFSVVPIDDLIHEGDHAGTIHLSVASADVLYNGLTSPPLPVPIEDNDCASLDAPDGGILSSCSNEHGKFCTVQCGQGLDPAMPVVLQCLSTGVWNASVPRCTRCAQGHYLNADGVCTRCSTTLCPNIGTYRSTCTSSADGLCVPCTVKPLNSHFTASAFDRDNCSHVCDEGFFSSSQSCHPCSNASCAIGHYRAACTANADGECIPCTNFHPVNSHFTSQGGISRRCNWACDRGFEMTQDASACAPIPVAALLISPIHLHTKEEIGSPPGNFTIALSREPHGDVIATLSPQAQLQACDPDQVVFTSNDYGPVTIACSAVDDIVPEGPHVGTVVVILDSAYDIEYKEVTPERVDIAITEASCPILSDQGNYHVLECNRTLEGLCQLQCRSGFEPSSPAVLQCTEQSAGYPIWSGERPSCVDCLPQYYRNGSECRPCQTSSCRKGFFRSPCVSPFGAECVACTNPLPTNAYYSSAGEPYNTDSCHWECVASAFFHNASFSCLQDIQPSLILKVVLGNTGEAMGSLPAIVSVSLSMQPAASVAVHLESMLAQLKAPSPLSIDFTPFTWNSPVQVYVNAIDDTVFEGDHSGPILIRASSTDPRFQDLRSWVSIGIEDNDCPKLGKPLNGAVSLPCLHTGTQTRCEVVCSTGYMLYNSTGAVAMTCDKATGTWDRRLPDCVLCAAGYFNASGNCLPCSSSRCPAGRYRGVCTQQSDAICKMCNVLSKPQHSHWTAGGVPFDGNGCNWTCDLGYVLSSPDSRVNGTRFNASQRCTKLSDGKSGLNDPIDSDNDSIPDVIEGDDSIDTDHDGVPNYLDLDSDGDGIPDAVEGAEDTDLDGFGDYTDHDSDGDGILDEEEGTDDVDNDGFPNYVDLDSDGDGLPDEVEGSSDQDGDDKPNYLDLDSDGDGILDQTEGKSDPDGDSVPAFLDLDSDGDGLPDSYETDVDTDGDGIGDFLDTDSDNDFVPDVIEGGFDSDNDGTPDFRDVDSDGDGILDKTEGFIDTDNDNVPDRLDLDSDNDCLGDRQEGVPNWRFANWTACASESPVAPLDTDRDGLLDSYEGDADVDLDGIPNFEDLDSDGDGIPDESEGVGDVDNDGIPNFLDLDSDGDSIQDCEEGMADQDQDGTPNFLDLDSDNDGISDQIECRCWEARATLACGRADDADKDGVPNYLDLDSDSDGLLDSVEGTKDDNGNGLPNYVDPFSASDNGQRVIIDSDGDGIPDSVEGSNDFDGDAIPNFLDKDSDADGINDEVEGTLDKDRDGRPDFLDPVHDEEEPLVCRSPGCRRVGRVEDADVVEDDEADSISETELLLLLVLLVLLPCCVCYMQCGIVSCLAGYRMWCPHCKEPLEKCHAGRVTVTLSSVPFEKGTDSDAVAEFREQFRRDVCSALALTNAQVSVHAPDSHKGIHRLTIHLASTLAASTLERQIKDFDSDRLADLLPETRLLFKPHHNKHNDQHSLQQPTTNADLSAEDIVAAFCRQSSDPSSRLKRGKYTQFIVEVQTSTVSTCSECDKDGKFCSCHCHCCGHRKGGCPALCQRYCDHCAAPNQLCSSGVHVEVILDLHREAIPGGDQEMFRHALRMEIADALAIHPMQASISGVRFGSIHVDVQFISCNDAAWALGYPGFCFLSDHKRLKDSMAEASDSQKDANLASSFHLGSFSGARSPAPSNGAFDTRDCRCPTRVQLLALFMQQCEDKDSRLRKGTFFSATASATRWYHKHQSSVLCRICNQTKSWCQCKCQGCRRRLNACRADCLMPVRQSLILPATPPQNVDPPPAKPSQPSIKFPQTLDLRKQQLASNGSSERVAQIVGNDGLKILPTHASRPRAISRTVNRDSILGSSATLVADMVTITRSDIAPATTMPPRQHSFTFGQQPEVAVVFDSDWTLAQQRQKSPRRPSPEPPRHSSQSTPQKPRPSPRPPSVDFSRGTEAGQLVKTEAQEGQGASLQVSQSTLKDMNASSLHSAKWLPPARDADSNLQDTGATMGSDWDDWPTAPDVGINLQVTGATIGSDWDDLPNGTGVAPMASEPPLPHPSEVGRDAWASREVMEQRGDFQSSAQALTHTTSFASSAFVKEEYGKHDKSTMNTESASALASSPSARSVFQPAPHKVVAISEATAGFVGLVISKELPHAVACAVYLVDINSVPQGQPGYSNAEVRVGDLILEIDGQDVRSMSLAQCYQLLRGRLYSVVQITLKQWQSGVVYTVRVLRHRFHEFDSTAAKSSLPPFANDDDEWALFSKRQQRPTTKRRELELSLSLPTKGPVSRNSDACFAGLEVTEQPPHAVVAIDDLVDPHFVTQGDPGYSNPTVHVGDRILAVAGRPAEHVPVRELHEMLSGPQHSVVDLTLASKSAGNVYTIRVLRHRFHEFNFR